MIEARLKIKMPETCAVAAVRASKKAQVKLLDTTPFDTEGVKSLLQIESQACLDEVLGEIRSENLEEVSVLTDSEARGAFTVQKCIPARSILESGCFIKSAQHTEEGVEWEIVARRPSLLNLTEILEEKNYSFDIKRIGDLEREEEILTEKESRMLEYALGMGYFDSPKKIGIRQVANHFGISISTASDLLRRGMKRLLLKHFQ